MLIDDIEDIRLGLRSGRFLNEASVSQGIVLRLLSALGWPTYDTQVVTPEFVVEGLRVDFALSHPPARPLVFVEVKQVGKSDGSERQLFEYAYHRGVPLAVLTDGQEWNFFLPAEAGDYSERRVYKLDLLEREVSESADRLVRYLKYASVCSGKALTDTRADHQDLTRARRTADTLPAAWAKLVEEEDDLLLELLADRVESLCGYKPDLDSTARFLRSGLRLSSTPIAAAAPAPGPVRTAPAVRNDTAEGTGTFSFTVLGNRVQCRNGRELLIRLLEALADRDTAFLDRFAALPRHGRRRRYIAIDRAELYPGRPDLAEEHSYRLKSGYWVGINLSRSAIERIAEIACGVADLRFGTDVSIVLG